MYINKLTFISVLGLFFLIQGCGSDDSDVSQQNQDTQEVEQVETPKATQSEDDADSVALADEPTNSSSESSDDSDIASSNDEETTNEQDVAVTDEEEDENQPIDEFDKVIFPWKHIVEARYFFKETATHYIALYDGVRCLDLHFKSKHTNEFWTVAMDRYPKKFNTSAFDYLKLRCDSQEMKKHRVRTKEIISQSENKNYIAKNSKILFKNKLEVKRFGLSLIKASHQIQARDEAIVEKTKTVAYKVGKLHEIMGSDITRKGDSTFIVKNKWIYTVNRYKFVEIK